MNDQKWSEVFHLLHRHINTDVVFRMKMVGNDRVWNDTYFRPANHRWTDSRNGPFEHRHIEWLEVTGPDASLLKQAIEILGLLPLVTVAGGFKLQAYGILHEQ